MARGRTLEMGEEPTTPPAPGRTLFVVGPPTRYARYTDKPLRICQIERDGACRLLYTKHSL